MAIPIALLISHAPDLLSAATKLWNTWQARATPAAVDPSGDIASQLAAISGRLRTLEDGGEAQAELVKNMAEQAAALSGVLATVSRRSNIALALGGAALLVALVTAGLLLSR